MHIIRAVCAYSDLFPNNMRAYVFSVLMQCKNAISISFACLVNTRQWCMPTDADEAKFA